MFFYPYFSFYVYCLSVILHCLLALLCFTSSAQLKIDGCFAHLFSISPTVPHRLFKSKFEGSHLLLIGKEKWRWVPSILDCSKRNTKEAGGDGVFRWCWSEEGGKVAFVDGVCHSSGSLFSIFDSIFSHNSR